MHKSLFPASLPPALIARAAFREVCTPLYLEMPRHDGARPASVVEYEAEDARVSADGITIGGEIEDED